MPYGQRHLRLGWPLIVALWVSLIAIATFTLWMFHRFQNEIHFMDLAMARGSMPLAMAAEAAEHRLFDLVAKATLFFVLLALAFGALVTALLKNLMNLLRRLGTVLDGTVVALANAIEVRDENTGRHSEEIGSYAQELALRLGLGPEEAHLVKLGAVLHDIGKIGIPDSILSKPGRLSPEETRIMRSHPDIGAEIMRGLDGLEALIPLIRHHQERYDGGGYPDGLRGEEIPLGARIIAVVDAYQAMTSDRPYRKARPPEEAVAELVRNSGTQFDPRVVSAFLKLLNVSPPAALPPAG